jgi:hypothetical protein
VGTQWCAPWMALAVVLLAPAAAPAASIRVKLHRPHRGIQVRLAPVVVPAAQEREVCQAIELPNREPMDVAVLQFATPGGRTYLSHHFALFVDDVDTMAELPTGPVNSPGCAGVGQAFGAILAGVQAPRATVRFPPGVGFTFKAHRCPTATGGHRAHLSLVLSRGRAAQTSAQNVLARSDAAR